MTNNEAPLLDTAELARLQLKARDIRGRAARPAGSPYAGPNASIFRGRGMELEDVRPYHPGDDVRHMHWRVTARSGRPSSKVFRDERQRLRYLMVDRRAPMGFGTRGELKAATAARVAAVLAFAALGAQERVAGLVFDDQRRWSFSPSQRLEDVLSLLKAASAPWPTQLAPRLHLAEMLSQIDRGMPYGGAVALISDFHDLQDQHRGILYHLAQRHEVLAVQIVDPAEERLPDIGAVRFIAPQGGQAVVIDSSDEDLRARYAAAMAERAGAVRALLHRCGITTLRAHTNDDVFHALGEAL